MGSVSKGAGGQRAMLGLTKSIGAPVSVPGTRQMLHHAEPILRGCMR